MTLQSPGPSEWVKMSIPVLLASSPLFKISLSLSCRESLVEPPSWLLDPISRILKGEASPEDYKGDERIMIITILYGGTILFDTSIPSDPIPLSRLHISGSYSLVKGGESPIIAGDREILSLWRRLFTTGRIPGEVSLIYPSGYTLSPSQEGECEVPPVGFEAFIE